MKSATLTTLFAAALASRADQSLDWHIIASDSATSTNTEYAITGTIGQPATSASAGGRYIVQSGFWGLIAAIQTPGAPLLRIINTGTNAVAVAWPISQTLFTLQENTSLNSTNWVSVGVTPTNDGTNNTVLIAPAAGNRFFRLKWP